VDRGAYFIRRKVMRSSPSARCARAEARSASLGSGHDAEKVRSLTEALKRLLRPFTAHHMTAKVVECAVNRHQRFHNRSSMP